MGFRFLLYSVYTWYVAISTFFSCWLWDRGPGTHMVAIYLFCVAAVRLLPLLSPSERVGKGKGGDPNSFLFFVFLCVVSFRGMHIKNNPRHPTTPLFINNHFRFWRPRQGGGAYQNQVNLNYEQEQKKNDFRHFGHFGPEIPQHPTPLVCFLYQLMSFFEEFAVWSCVCYHSLFVF